MTGTMTGTPMTRSSSMIDNIILALLEVWTGADRRGTHGGRVEARGAESGSSPPRWTCLGRPADSAVHHMHRAWLPGAIWALLLKSC